MSRILIVDDEASVCWALREYLSDEGHGVSIAATAEEGLELARDTRLDAIVLDVRLPGMDGLTALRAFREAGGRAPVIVVTAFGNLDTAVRAMEGGAFDYLVKPFDLEQAGAVLRRALDARGARDAPLGNGAPPPAGPEDLVGASPAMQELFRKIALAAPADVSVLITGESGTGKELVARAIHRHSARRAGPFLPVCLAALSPSLIERELFGHVRGAFTGAEQDRKGLLELAHGGTVLLDEVGDIPPPLQVKLLRAIERREVTPVGDARPRPADIRVIAATHRPLGDLMAAGQFREDLFFRLSVFPIHVPPLRERRGDIPLLAAHFLRLSARSGTAGNLSIPEVVLKELAARDWSGNVRELRNAVEHAAIVARGRGIRPEDLPLPLPRATPGATSASQEIRDRVARWAAEDAGRSKGQVQKPSLYDRFLEVVEPPLLEAALKACRNNRAAAADFLGIHRATLRQKLRRHGIEPPR